MNSFNAAFILFLGMTLGLFLINCSDNTDRGESSLGANSIRTMVSIAPQKYFVQRIGGELVDIEVLTPPNYAAETYQITPRQMDAVGKASLYFRIGMPFEEPLVQRIADVYPQLTVVDTREGIPLRAMQGHHHHDGEEHEHHQCEAGDDPHIWLDPMLVKRFSETIARELSIRAPEHQPVFEKNLALLQQELDELHAWLLETLAPVKGRVMYVFHPAFGYFTDAYGLEQRAVETEGKSPGSRKLYNIVDEIKFTGAKAVFEQPQFSSAELRTIAQETGVSIILLDDLSEDYFTNMKHMATEVRKYLQ